MLPIPADKKSMKCSNISGICSCGNIHSPAYKLLEIDLRYRIIPEKQGRHFPFFEIVL